MQGKFDVRIFNTYAVRQSHIKVKKILKEIKLPCLLIIGYIIFLIITTITHELGHYIVAKIYGYDAVLHYNMTEVSYINSQNGSNQAHSFWITLAGSIQAMVFGVIGIITLYKKKIFFKEANKLRIRQWIIIFFSLSFLTYTINFFFWMIVYTNTFSLEIKPDEVRIAEYLKIPAELILLILAIIGILSFRYVVKYCIPKKIKTVLILSIFIAYFLFFPIWMKLLGPLILP